MTEISPMRRRMIEDITVSNLAPATQRSYVQAVTKFSRFFGRSPDRLALECQRRSETRPARRRGENAGRMLGRSVPPAPEISRMMTIDREQLSQADAITVAAIEIGVPALAAARALLERFQHMLRSRDVAALTPWLVEAGGSLLASFGGRISGDLAAVRAALTEAWSNGQTEGQITTLGLVERQIYGRARLDLLRARLVVAA